MWACVTKQSLTIQPKFKHTLRRRKGYYSVLRVKSDASQADIKTAYYKLCLMYHPDLNKGKHANEIFKEINNAYRVLGNIQIRRMYDHDLFELKDEKKLRRYNTSKSSCVVDFIRRNDEVMARTYPGNEDTNKRKPKSKVRCAFGVMFALMTWLASAISQAQHELRNQRNLRRQKLLKSDYITSK